jgi:ketosteroid isomerase-like protein
LYEGNKPLDQQTAGLFTEWFATTTRGPKVLEMKKTEYLKAAWIVLNAVWAVGCSIPSPDRKVADVTEDAETDVSIRLLRMENEWAQVDVTNDKSVFQRLIAPDFVSTSSRNGIFRANRKEWLDAWEYEGTKTATNVDMKVHIYGNNVAVVTGIDATSGTDKDGTQWAHQDRFTDTWVKRDGVWRCVAAHVTRIK